MGCSGSLSWTGKAVICYPRCTVRNINFLSWIRTKKVPVRLQMRFLALLPYYFGFCMGGNENFRIFAVEFWSCTGRNEFFLIFAVENKGLVRVKMRLLSFLP